MSAATETDVLLVEDNPADVDLVREILEDRGACRISVAKNGEEAMFVLQESKQAGAATVPSLIVLDLNLPGKDGRAILAEVKGDRVLKRIPVLVFTASQAQRDIESAYELGANCYVSKPGSLGDFMAVVKRIGEFWLSSAHLPRRVAA